MSKAEEFRSTAFPGTVSRRVSLSSSLERGNPLIAATAPIITAFAATAAKEVADAAMQVLGGYGYCTEYRVEQFFRDAKLNQIGEGASEVHKTVIGRHVVRRARSAERHPCLPQGRAVDSEHFALKLAWLRRLREMFEARYAPEQQVVWVGDFNVAPQPIPVPAPEEEEPLRPSNRARR